MMTVLPPPNLAGAKRMPGTPRIASVPVRAFLRTMSARVKNVPRAELRR